MKKTLLATSLIAFLLSPAIAEDNSLKGLSIGLGVGYQQQPFVGDNSEWLPVPHLEYKSGMLFVKGLKIGLDVIELDNTTVDVHLKYQALNFKPSDSHGAFTLLDRRKSTILLGTGINHRFNNNAFVSAEINGDILGHSKGLNADVSAGYIYQVTEHFTLIPKAGLTWDSDKHNRYYYGVSKDESRRTGIQEYRPDSTITPHIAVGMIVKATDRFHVFGGMEMKFLPSKVKNSPITNRSTLSSFALGINYNF
ncbi:MipA/OmpV family protein [Ignatzschineria sp. LJL83]